MPNLVALYTAIINNILAVVSLCATIFLGLFSVCLAKHYNRKSKEWNDKADKTLLKISKTLDAQYETISKTEAAVKNVELGLRELSTALPVQVRTPEVENALHHISLASAAMTANLTGITGLRDSTRLYVKEMDALVSSISGDYLRDSKSAVNTPKSTVNDSIRNKK